MNTLSRRSLFMGSAGFSAAAIAGSAWSNASASASPEQLARAEDHWADIALQYDTMTDITNLENGYWGMMAKPVLAHYQARTIQVNRENSYYARRVFNQESLAARRRLAELLGVETGEIAFTRGATEALQNLIGGYHRVTAHDAVMFADLDYGAMQAAMASVAVRVGADVVKLEIPEPADYDGLLAFYAKALDDHPQTKLLLLTHISHRTGLCLPIRQITALARARGVDTIVDAAHSWGQMDFQIADLGADFVGFNLHKWIGAPLGVGLLYINKARLDAITPNISAEPYEKDLTSGRVHTGTTNFAAILSVTAALDFHQHIGPKHKEQRLRYLRNRWVAGVQDLPNIEILTPNDARLHAGITSFRVKGRTTAQANIALVETLLREHQIFTVHRTGIASGACVRISPSMYNLAADMDRLVEALAHI